MKSPFRLGGADPIDVRVEDCPPCCALKAHCLDHCEAARHSFLRRMSVPCPGIEMPKGAKPESLRRVAILGGIGLALKLVAASFAILFSVGAMNETCDEGPAAVDVAAATLSAIVGHYQGTKHEAPAKRKCPAYEVVELPRGAGACAVRCEPDLTDLTLDWCSAMQDREACLQSCAIGGAQ